MTTSWGAPRWPPNYSSEGGYAPLGLPRPTLGAPRRSRGTPRYSDRLTKRAEPRGPRRVVSLHRQIRGARRCNRAARGELNDERVLARPVRSRPDGAAPVRREHDEASILR